MTTDFCTELLCKNTVKKRLFSGARGAKIGGEEPNFCKLCKQLTFRVLRNWQIERYVFHRLASVFNRLENHMC